MRRRFAAVLPQPEAVLAPVSYRSSRRRRRRKRLLLKVPINMKGYMKYLPVEGFFEPAVQSVIDIATE